MNDITDVIMKLDGIASVLNGLACHYESQSTMTDAQSEKALTFLFFETAKCAEFLSAHELELTRALNEQAT